MVIEKLKEAHLQFQDIKNFVIKYKNSLFALLVTIVILWQLLLPGYIILLDWPAGPLLKFQFNDIASFINAPGNLFFIGLNRFFPGWAIQKFLIFGIFFLLVYLPLKLLSNDNFRLFPETFAKYFLALFLAINPFVYERFIAGQWRVLVGYLAIFPLIYFIISFHNRGTFPSWRQAGNIFLTLLVTGFFSIHFLVINTIIVIFYIFFRLLLTSGKIIKNQIFITEKKQKYFVWLVKIVAAGIAFIVASSYWLIPYFRKEGLVFNNFDTIHRQAFATAQNEEWSVLENVATMHGFWEESHKWIEEFKLPKNHPLFMIGFYILIVLVILGLFSFWRNKKYRWLAIWLFLLGLTSVVFSAGTQNNIFQNINLWLFDNVSFWKGFRDTQKWSGVLVVVYALLASRGIGAIAKIVNKKFHRFKYGEQIIVGGGIILVLLITPQMLFGFNKQIKPVWYPTDWTEVSQKLAQQKEIRDQSVRILFLPWHQYYSLQFNDHRLSANPANNFFPGRIVWGHNTELWNIKPIAVNTPNYSLLEKRIISNNPNREFIDETINIFKNNNIKYIIWTNDFAKFDIYRYPFLNSPSLKKIVNKNNIILYELKNFQNNPVNFLYFSRTFCLSSKTNVLSTRIDTPALTGGVLFILQAALVPHLPRLVYGHILELFFH